MASRGQTTAMNQIDTIINLWDERLAPAGKTGRLSIDSAAANNDAESISHWGGGHDCVLDVFLAVHYSQNEYPYCGHYVHEKDSGGVRQCGQVRWEADRTQMMSEGNNCDESM